MKKAFLIGLGAMMVMAMVFTGCDNATQTVRSYSTEYKGMEILPPPDSVRAYAYGPTGFIRVAWDAVPNASGYLVYRKAAVGNGPTTVTLVARKTADFVSISPSSLTAPITTPGNGDLYYDDLISYANEFRTGTNYTYRVVAVSRWSSNSADSSWAPGSIGNTDWIILQNSYKDSNSVSFPTGGSNALLPAGRQLAKPTGLSLRKSTVYDPADYSTSDIVQVTWTAVPGVDYLVAYGIANDTGPASMRFRAYITASGSIDTEQRTAAYTIPLIYGKTAVEVVAKQKGVPAGDDPYYYLDSEPARVIETFAAAGPAAPAGVIGRPRPTGEIEVGWPVVPGAASYKVYRVLTNNTSTFGSTIPPNTIAYQAWEDITSRGIIYSYGTSVGSTPPAPFGWAGLIDNNRPRDDVSIYYMVVAVNSTGGMSLPTISAAVGSPVSIKLTADALGWDDETEDYLGIHIYWNPRNWATDYRLYRAEEKRNGNYPANWNEITDGITLTGDSQNYFYGVTEKPEGRKNYVYKLVTGFGETIYSNVVETAQYIVDLPIQLVVSDAPPLPTGINDRAFAYELGVRINPKSGYTARHVGKLWKDTEVVEISRTKTDRQHQTLGNNYVSVKSITKADVGIIGSWFLDPGIDNKPGCWGYMARVSDNGVISMVDAPATGWTATSSDSVLSGGMGVTIEDRNTSNPFVQHVGSASSRVDKAEIIIRYATGLDQLDAQGKYTRGDFFTTLRTLERVGSTDTYRTTSVPVGSGGVYIEVFYKDGGFQPGETGIQIASDQW
ncbi:MAG: hypothetical protein LBQ69_07275 [Treponema sp.]|jgi:hypothetical protein|nr:hypothetical protein [Treponema sp.]